MSIYRTAVTSFMSHSIGSVVYRCASLLLIAIYAQTLGPNAVGRLEQLLAISLLLGPVLSLQVPEAFLAIQKRMPQTAITIALVATCVAVMLSIGVVTLASSAGRIQGLAAIALALHISASITWQLARNVLRSQGSFRLLVISELIQSVVTLGIGVLLLQIDVGYLGVMIAIAMGGATACGVAAIGTIRSDLLPHLSGVRWSGLLHVAKMSGRLLPNFILWWAIELLDRFLIAHYLGDHDVGIYSSAARVVSIGMAICLLIYQSWQVPAIRALAANVNPFRFFRTTFSWYAGAISLTLSILACCVAPVTTIMFGAEFSGASRIAGLLIISCYLASFCYFYGVTLYLEGSRVSSWKAPLCGLLVSLAINLALIPTFGMLAAAISMIAAYAAILFVRHRESSALLGVKLTFAGFFLPLLILGAQAIAIYNEISSLLVSIGAIGMAAIYRNTIMKMLRHALS